MLPLTTMKLGKAVRRWGSRPAGLLSAPISRTCAEAEAIAATMNPAPMAPRSTDLNMRLFSLASRKRFYRLSARACHGPISYHSGPLRGLWYGLAQSSLSAEDSMPQPSAVTAIGVISGTSMDGIDVSVVETDGDAVVAPGPGRTFSYPEDLRCRLQELIAEPARAQSEPLEELDRAVTDAHIAAIRRFMSEAGLQPDDIGLIGFHGQTVYHRPEIRFTRQLGTGARVARELGTDT